MTQIKICGMRRREDIEAVNAVLPDYIGFICTDRFWRYIPKEQAAQLKNQLDQRIKAVGVFVNEEIDYVVSYVTDNVIDMVQLHGSEDNIYIDALKKQIPDTPVIKAFRIRSQEDLILAEESQADLVLLDNGTGTGETFDWNLIRDFKRPYLLAGGLNPDNIQEAVNRFHPLGIDISSGVETDKVKDPVKIRMAVDAARKGNDA